MGKVISIVNHKGGVGKTMTSQNLGAALALSGKKVLLVDFDPQCNLTSQVISEATVPTISNVLNDDLKVVGQEVLPNLFILPGAEELDEDSLNLAAMDDVKEASHVLKTALKTCKNDYDFILIDAAPGSSMLMVNAITAADVILVPISDKNSINGAKKLSKIIKAYKVKAKGYYLLTRYDGRLSIHKEIRNLLITKNRDALLYTTIRQCEQLNQAACQGLDIFRFNKKSNGAADYMDLATEIIGQGQGDEAMPF
ncbi:MAG: ParA family protein [Bacteroidaceae bacterium]|nr:ParA family protein [Bacteroidaceae bacterium]